MNIAALGKAAFATDTLAMDACALKSWRRDGLHRFAGAARDDLSALHDMAAALPPVTGGRRLRGSAFAPLLGAEVRIGRVADRLLPGAFPVRAILFDKSAAANWAVGWHQDRTIAVRARREVAGFGPWSMKAGVSHVAPPIGVLARMVTLRVHLDAVDVDNAPLLVACGSHRLGRVEEKRIAGAVAAHPTITCLAEPGDIWAYATPILHASERARRPRRRRVLQVDYAAEALPGGLVWDGV